MDTKTLITEAKARFNHNSAKSYLKDKYSSKFIIADQSGLWRADPQTISLLSALSDSEFVVLIDTFDHPVMVDREQLLKILTTTYESVMLAWYKEWKELESKR